jgi:hypothetical protein
LDKHVKGVDYDDVSPDPSSMIESMRAHGYTLPAAVADLVDNSIAAGARNVWVDFKWRGGKSWVTVRDNGRGMDKHELRNAMRLGSISPLKERASGDLGRFGLGLKTASFSQARRLTVASTKFGSATVVRRWDLDYLCATEGPEWRLLIGAAANSESRLVLPDGVETGTVVLWEVLDRLVDIACDDNDETHRKRFLRMVGEVENHLSMVFHRYLTGPAKRLSISHNGKAIAGWDPFLTDVSSPTPEETIHLEGYTEPVRVKGYVLPHKDKLGAERHRQASGPAGWNAQQGFYVYRNERLIVAGDWLGLRRGGDRPWTKEEHYKLARIRIDIPNSMDHLWQLDVKKSTARPPTLIRERLAGLAYGVRQEARSVFSHRGKYGERKRKQEVERPWKAVRGKSGVRYRIDREHPLAVATRAALTPLQEAHLEAFLAILEETVPIQQIWLDAAESPDDQAKPFSSFSAKRIEQLILMCYQAMREYRSLSHEQAIAELLVREEFGDEESRAIIATSFAQETSNE